jgi:hypothetical protein
MICECAKFSSSEKCGLGVSPKKAPFQESSFSHQADEVAIVSSKLLRSLSLAVVLSFFAPMLLMSGSLASTWLLTCIPGLGSIGQIPTNMLLDVLDTFGGGCPLQGMLTIGLVCGFVGALFDIYVFYNFRTQR